MRDTGVRERGLGTSRPQDLTPDTHTNTHTLWYMNTTTHLHTRCLMSTHVHICTHTNTETHIYL